VVARSEQGAKKTESVDLGKILSSAIGSIKMKSDEKSITIQEDFAEHVTVNGDASALERTVLNLLDNAVAYTDEGGSVSVILAKDSLQARITIKDTGIGISEADMPNIFKRFYKADAARSHRPGSAGLGLAIVKEIVTSHGGSISVTSQIGKGTEFTLLFPLS
jgi:two-component system phosphate regulon sensor histidine kinase PhoR